MKQVIVIKLDETFYGIDVNLVQEVIYTYTSRPLPEAPNFIEGLAYVREQLLPIVKTKRLFETDFFDLYHNSRRVLILSFKRIKELQHMSVYSNIGIVVDEVIGIETYTEEEIFDVPSVYSTKISYQIQGFIEKKGIKIGILNILNFFVDHDGNFRYQKYIPKSKQESAPEYSFSKDDMMLVEKAIKGYYPFIAITKKPILFYLSRLSRFENTNIAGLLKSNTNFFRDNKHAQSIKDIHTLFYNMVDIYAILEYVLTNYDDKNHINILVADNKEGSIAASLNIALDSLGKNKSFYNIDRYIVDTEKETENLEILYTYDYNQLVHLTHEMLDKYFDQKEEKYTLKSFYQQKIATISELSASHINKKYSIVYMPNFFAYHFEDIEFYLKELEKVVEKQGILILGLFEDIEDFAKSFKKYYIKSRLVFTRVS